MKKRLAFFLINNVYAGTKSKSFEVKRRLLNSIGHEIGEGTKIVGPIYCTGKLIIEKDCWIGKNFTVNGNGKVKICSNCDVAPDVHIQTGGHEIGSHERRAGKGIVFDTYIGKGCWIGARSTILGGVKVGNGCVVAACACVCNDVKDDLLVGGVPAKIIRDLSND